jgi:hypothetical protein
MAKSLFKFAPGVVMEERTVTLREDGSVLGVVKKYKRHYNLARPFTVRGWTAKPPGERPLSREQGVGFKRPIVFNTREEAARALYDHDAQIEGDPPS